jgi:hypothetical protein
VKVEEVELRSGVDRLRRRNSGPRAGSVRGKRGTGGKCEIGLGRAPDGKRVPANAGNAAVAESTAAAVITEN